MGDIDFVATASALHQNRLGLDPGNQTQRTMFRRDFDSAQSLRQFSTRDLCNIHSAIVHSASPGPDAS
jgi:hypothetical protein